MRTLRYAALVYAAGTILHTVDHFRRGIHSVSGQVFWLGNIGLVAAAVTIGLALAGHRLAPMFAVVFAPVHGLGIAVHLPPDWGVLSDSFWSYSAAAISWVAVSAEVAGAFALAGAGAAILRSRRLSTA